MKQHQMPAGEDQTWSVASYRCTVADCGKTLTVAHAGHLTIDEVDRFRREVAQHELGHHPISPPARTWWRRKGKL